jgi:hypothetical protein
MAKAKGRWQPAALGLGQQLVGRSITTQPAAVEGYAYEQLRLNAHSDDVLALATAPRDLCFLYSEASAIGNGMSTTGYLVSMMRVFEAATFLSVPLGFVTEAQVQRGELHDCKVLLLPSVRHVLSSTLPAIETIAAAARGSVVVIGESRDEALALDPRSRTHARRHGYSSRHCCRSF